MSSGDEDKDRKFALTLILFAWLLAATGVGIYLLGGTGSPSLATALQEEEEGEETPDQAWKPDRPIELVIMAGKGGDADRLGRFIQEIIESNGLSEQPFIPVNMGGESGAEALRYMKRNARNPHVVMIAVNNIYSTPQRSPEIDLNILKFTPIARMVGDTFLLWVNADQDIYSVDDYVAAVRAAGSTNWRMGGNGLGDEGSRVTALLEQAYGIKHKYRPFKNGETVARNLIEGSVQSTLNNTSEQQSFYRAGRSRPLVAFAPDRLAAFPDVPTFRELGHDLVYFTQGNIVTAAGNSQAANAYYQKLFRRVYVSKQWRTYAKDRAPNHAFLRDTPLLMHFAGSPSRAQRRL